VGTLALLQICQARILVFLGSLRYRNTHTSSSVKRPIWIAMEAYLKSKRNSIRRQSGYLSFQQAARFRPHEVIYEVTTLIDIAFSADDLLKPSHARTIGPLVTTSISVDLAVLLYYLIITPSKGYQRIEIVDSNWRLVTWTSNVCFHRAAQ